MEIDPLSTPYESRPNRTGGCSIIYSLAPWLGLTLSASLLADFSLVRPQLECCSPCLDHPHTPRKTGTRSDAIQRGATLVLLYLDHTVLKACQP